MIKQKHEKEIVALDIFEAVRLRPTMYLGQVAHVEEKLPMVEIEDGKASIKQREMKWSPGFMHLLVEIFDNALDEAKRMKGKMKTISVRIRLDDNWIEVTDTGNGFHKAASRHKKTKKSVVRTAFEELHAGSNFTETDKNVIGTHGVGASIVNILSEEFYVKTVNRTHVVECEWKDYKNTKEVKKARDGEALGTTVKFCPSKEVFPKFKWELDLLRTYLTYKKFLISLDPKIKNLKLDVKYKEGSKWKDLELSEDFIPKDHVRVDHKELGTIVLWEKYPDSCSISFVNGSQCTGIHQKIVNDWVNEQLDYNFAHHFYDTLISLNLPSSLVRWADQNKTKLATGRWEFEDKLKYNFHRGFMNRLKNSDITTRLLKKIEEKLFAENIKKIKKEKKAVKRKISEKYTSASKRKVWLYITEGLSAAGSVKQARDSANEGVYALKGKIKNTKTITDLTENKEIIEIMSILNLEPRSLNMPTYENIIIAADEDPDGQHIASLVVNFFWKWFPHIIRAGKLHKLVTPLVVASHFSKRVYFYTLSDFEAYRKKYKITNVNYLKGLGSLSMDDWEHVMAEKILFKIEEDPESEKYLEMAFGSSSQKRKEWLEGIEL